MNIEYYPKKIAVERIKYSRPMMAIIDLQGENAVVAPFLDLESHENLLCCAIDEFDSIKNSDLDGYFLIFFDKDIADWSFKLPKNYKELQERNERSKQYYLDGFVAISNFLKEFNFLVGINIPQKYLKTK